MVYFERIVWRHVSEAIFWGCRFYVAEISSYATVDLAVLYWRKKHFFNKKHFTYNVTISKLTARRHQSVLRQHVIFPLLPLMRLQWCLKRCISISLCNKTDVIILFFSSFYQYIHFIHVSWNNYFAVGFWNV